jgi:bifunctional UDP-N-acetylglucosamine pyrophosphorylase/glucosamine-1-phosphate N-acetyltransferase
VILAAGKGTRMKSRNAKVLQPLCGREMIHYPVETALALAPRKTIVVVGHDAEKVRESLKGYPLEFVLQPEQKGTGHAVMQALPVLTDFRGSVVVYYGDAPLLGPQDVQSLISERERTGAALAFLTANLERPAGYGRIIRKDSRIQRIVEEKDATPEEKKITEVNPGIYCFEAEALRAALAQLGNKNLQGEYYLTDTMEILLRMGRKVVPVLSDQSENLLGVNTRAELAGTAVKIWLRRADALMAQGVTIHRPDSVCISHEAEVGTDAVLYPNVILEGKTLIGERAVVHSNSRIVNSRIGPDAEILDCCLITDSAVGAGTTVGPFAHLRPGAEIGEHCRIGNFVEVKNSRVGDQSKAAHLTYLGDAQVGRNVNIGAGTITCNYDGFTKSPTHIGDGAFIGSDSQLIAPVKIGERAYIAAGSSITEDVPPEALGIARARQMNKEGWVRRRGGKKGKEGE